MDLGQEQRLAACLRAFAQLRAQERTALYNAAAVADGVIAFSVTVDELSQRWDWDLPVRRPSLHVRSKFARPTLTVEACPFVQLKALLKSAVRVTLVVGAAGIHIIHAGVTVETVPMRRVAACTVEQSPAKVGIPHPLKCQLA